MNDQLPKKLSSFIWHFLKPYQLVVSMFICFAIAAGWLGPFNSILIKQIINLLPQVQKGNVACLTWPAIFIVLNFIIFDNVTWRSIDYINYKFKPIIKNQIISQMLDVVLGNSYQFFQDNLSGRIANQITTLADNLELILHRISADFIRGTSMLIASFITAYYVNPRFFYILFLWFIAFSSVSIFMSKRLVNLADQHANSESIVSGQLVDSITNHSNVRIFSNRNYEISRMNQFLLACRKACQKKDFFLFILSSLQGSLIAIMMGFAIYCLIYLYKQYLISIGDFALILGLSMELGYMMWYTMSRVDEFNQAIGKCKQSLSAIMIQADIRNQKNSPALAIHKGEIIFEQVKFCYKDSAPLFDNKSITIEAGQKIGLVGYSGSGKSTFVHLILRFYDVTEGRILIDGQDIRTLTQESLREHIAMIPQDPILFQRSLMENIRYSKIESSNQAVIDAAKKAHADEFIMKLPHGYESLVGERGIKLSGGQRQRIAIARAILKNAPILILDEATSQLDSVTEHHIQNSLWQLMQNKTTIVIAHRLSTLLHMDRLLVFDQGKIIEEGTHTELLKKNGLYKTLWDAQVGGFLPDKKNND